MKTADSWDVIQGDEGCRDGHYRDKQDLRPAKVTGTGSQRLHFPTSAKPNRFGQAPGRSRV
jgi:hypothetical protein